MIDQKDLKQIELLSEWLDTKFKIPVINYKVGLDPIIGLFPVLGDLLTFVVSVFLSTKMIKNGASGQLIFKLMGNVLVDFVVGSIPVLGSIFDFSFRANERNVELIKEHYLQDKHIGSGKKEFAISLTVLFFSVIVLGIILCYVLYKAIKWGVSFM